MSGAGVANASYGVPDLGMTSMAALRVYTAIREDGSQRSVVDTMQSREDLYDLIGYEGYASSLDELFATKPHGDSGTGD